MKQLKRLHPAFEMLGIFAIAFALRILFNMSLENRLCHFGDAFYFLTSGAQLLTAIKTGVFAHLSDLHAQATLGVQAMTSVSFVDRMLIDGPVFPAYLAFVQNLLGLNPITPQFDAHSLQLAVSNSFLDSIACLCIYQIARLSFDRTSARIAGLLAATYPAAILNTASCYSEPFSYFLLSVWIPLWLAARLRHIGTPAKLTLGFSTGVSSGLLMLAKPIFVALPPLFAILSLLGLRQTHRRRVAVMTAGLGLLGLAFTFAPWLFFTGIVTGKTSLVVNRYPAFNFMMGNRLECDGWRQYPLPFVPTDMGAALTIAADEFKSSPAEYSAMEVRKATRLWAGSWNNFELSFGLSPAWQDCFHQFLLFAGALGLLLCLSQHKLKTRQSQAAILLAAVPVFHCIYIAFEPQSRYAFSAMPVVIALAGFALSKTNKARMVALVLTLSAALIVWHRFVPMISSSALVDSLVWLLAWSALCAVCLLGSAPSVVASMRQNGEAGKMPAPPGNPKLTKPALAVGTLVWLTVSATIIANSFFEPSRYETQIKVSPNSPLERSIALKDEDIRDGYLLVDVQSTDVAKNVIASINGKRLGEPIPWWQISPDNQELIAALSVQGRGMGSSIYDFRQWWAFPVPRSMLQAGSNLTRLNSTGAIVYGDKPAAYGSDGKALLPSLTRASWTKAFTTIYRNEPRIYARLPVSEQLSATRSVVPRCFLIGAQSSAVQKNAPAAECPSAETLALLDGSKEISGSYPPSFFVTPSAVRLRNNSAHAFQFASDVMAPKKSTRGFISVVFNGTVNGANKQWSSPWQPTELPATSAWSRWTFGDRIPADIAQSPDLSVSVMASPFPADLLFLNKKQALKRAIVMKNVTLKLSPLCVYPAPENNPVLH